MECGIGYKGIMFAYDEDNAKIIAWQNETQKDSNATDFDAGELVIKFLIWHDDLYALNKNGELLRLEKMLSSIEDDWAIVGDIGEAACDMVLYDDEIWIVGVSSLFSYNEVSIVDEEDLPAGCTFYNTIAVEDYIFFFGDDSAYTVVYSYDGTTFVRVFRDTTYGDKGDYSFYNVFGKQLMEDFNGKIFFSYVYNYTYAALRYYDVSTRQVYDIPEFSNIPNSLVIVGMKIIDGVLYLAVYDTVNDKSWIYVHVLEPYRKEQTIGIAKGDKVGKLYKVESDPILPSHHDKERIFYYPIYPVVATCGGSLKPLIKYGNRIEFYTDLNNVDDLINMNLKDVIDNICNALNCSVFITPENSAEVDIKDLVGRNDSFLTVSDDDGYGSVKIKEIESFIESENNFRKISVSWSNPLIGDGVESVGSNFNKTSEYSFDSFMVNNPVLAKNIALTIFDKIFNSEGMVLSISFSPFLRCNQNISIRTIGSNFYSDGTKEYKIVKAEHSQSEGYSKLTILERNLIYRKLEV